MVRARVAAELLCVLLAVLKCVARHDTVTWEAFESGDVALRESSLDLAHRRAGRAAVALLGTYAFQLVEGDRAAAPAAAGQAAAPSRRAAGSDVAIAAASAALKLDRGGGPTEAAQPATLLARHRGDHRILGKAEPLGAFQVKGRWRRGPSREAEIAQVLIIASAISAGALLCALGRRWPCVRVFGIVLLYFGVNSGFSLYVVFLLSDAEVSEELSLQGMPAAFFITAVQQVETFILLVLGFSVLSSTPWRYWPRLLTSREIPTILCLAVAFAANVGLNNFALSLMPVSLNLTIRCCLPPVTLIMQVLLNYLPGGAKSGSMLADVHWGEVTLMLAGVLFAGLVTLAREEDPAAQPDTRSTLWLGVVMCCCSVVAAAVMLALTQRLGTSNNLNPLDLAWYMSLPAAVSLVPPMLCLHHPVAWPGGKSLTDLQVLLTVFQLSPGVLAMLLVSGLLAVSYNLLQTWMVQSQSATFTAFAGCVNKAVTISISIFLGLESLPGGVWWAVMFFGIFGNITCFVAYASVRAGRQSADAQDTTDCGDDDKLVRKGKGHMPQRELLQPATARS